MSIRGGRSYIIIEIGNKKLTIDGELTTTPSFYAEASTIKHWSTPEGIIPINDTERDELIHKIIEESKNSKVPILFDGYPFPAESPPRESCANDE